MAEQLYTIQVSDYSNCTWPHYFVHIESVKAKHYHLEDYIPCFRKYAHDCLIEKGTFESPIPL